MACLAWHVEAWPHITLANRTDAVWPKEIGAWSIEIVWLIEVSGGPRSCNVDESEGLGAGWPGPADRSERLWAGLARACR